MTKRLKSLQNLAVSCFLALLAVSCSDVTDEDGILPDGKYPMTFTAAVDGLSVSRATTSVDGNTSWEADDLVAINKDEGTNYKVYKIIDAGSGAMSPDGEANTLYWNKTTETLAAWYPANCTIGNGGGVGEANITNQSSGYEDLENMLYAPAIPYTYTSSGSVAFTFCHALAKVNAMLTNGDGIEKSELSGATVCFMGYTAGILGYGGMTGSGSNGEITPKTETATDATTHTALVIPQQMQGKQFIKVTIGAGGAARDYYYTSTESNNANLEAGKQYNYTITVKKTGLDVTVTSNGVSWTDKLIPTTPDGIFAFYITAPTTGMTIAKTEDAATLQDNGDGSYTLSGGNKITITATSTYIKSIKGLYDVDANRTTYTLKSDILITGHTLADAKVGDFYCKSGEGENSSGYLIPGDVSSLTSEQKDACLGIVCWVGSEAYNDDPLLNEKHSGCTHGLVVALHDAGNDGMHWSDSYEEMQDWVNAENDNPYKNVVDLQATDKRCGYSNTLALIDYNAGNYSSRVGNDNKYRVLPVDAIQQYAVAHPAPVNSSGWYFPSVMELKYVCLGQGNTGGTNGKDNLNTYIGKVGGSSFGNGYYWSSTEYDSPDFNPYSGYAWRMGFFNGLASHEGYKDFYACRVRPLLAF